MLDAGEIVEFDEPFLLLKKASGTFLHIVEQSGSGECEKLRNMARQAYVSRHSQQEIDEEDTRE